MTPDQWFQLGQTISDFVSPIVTGVAAEMIRVNMEARRESRPKGNPDDDEPEAGEE